MPEITRETVLVPLQRILLDGEHVCTHDIRELGCPMLSAMRCQMLPWEHFEPARGWALYPHTGCPLAGLEAVEA